jgi:DNA polymerase elongation subunit (family B)
LKPNKNRRYRLNNAEVRKLGLEFNLRNRYRLSKEQEVELLKLREPQHQIKRLFFDIETSPNICYAWRIGYNLSLQPHDIIEERKIICISYKWEGEDKIHSLTWDKNQCDKQMLIDFVKVANTADELIAHNGDRFDIKWIRTRCIFHRVPMFPQYKTLDTLKKAKNGFNFNSNKLDYIAQFLGVGAKVQHRGFDMWKDVLKGSKEAMKELYMKITIENYKKKHIFESEYEDFTSEEIIEILVNLLICTGYSKENIIEIMNQYEV